MTKSIRRQERKKRAAGRIALRTIGNAAAAQVALSPDEQARARIRTANAAKATRERQRAIRLLNPLRDPPPDENVVSLQTRAQAQRRLADALTEKAAMAGTAGRTARRERKVYLAEARRLDIDAQAARERQLADHRQRQDNHEIETQAKVRGEELEEVATEVPEWVRDEHGAVVRDDRGLPVLNVERATTRRQKHGLDWLLTKGRLTPEQYRTGKAAEAIWLAAAQAAEPGRGEGGGGNGACRASTGPADWRLDATLRAARLEAMVTDMLGGPAGAEVVATCKSVCLEGKTIQKLTDDRYEKVRHEERLKLGLALIRTGMGGGLRVAA